MTYELRAMTINDYDDVSALWSSTEGLSISEDDSRERIELYLARNAELNFIASMNGEIVGSVLCGHDGRRGILRHLAVKDSCRGRGIARDLVRRAVSELAKQGIQKCNLYVLDAKPAARRFWEHMGWRKLEDDYRTFQVTTGA